MTTYYYLYSHVTFWPFGNMTVKVYFFKGTFPENFNTFETNWTTIFSFPYVVWQLNLLWLAILPTQSFWPFDLSVTWQSKCRVFLKGHSQKYQIFLKLIENTNTSSLPLVVWQLNLVGWSLIITWVYPHSYVTFWSFGHVTFKVQKFLKGHSQKIQIHLKLIERLIYLNFQESYDY